MDFKEHSIRVLNASCRNLLSSMLNIRKDLPQVTNDGRTILRDWRGLAELMGMDYVIIRRLLTAFDPTLHVLEWFEKTSDNSIGKLLQFLELMDRYDVIDDTSDVMSQDALLYGSRPQLLDAPVIPQVPREEAMLQQAAPSPRAARGTETRIITDKDTPNNPTMFDAYLCYDQSDEMFAKEMTQKLEEEYGLSLFVKDRNLLPGHIEFDALFRVIQERCNRLVVICSPSFVDSPTCNAILSLGQCLSMNQKMRYIVPVIYKHCNLPLQLQYLSKLDFTKINVFANLWDQLADSIRIRTAASPRVQVKRPNGQSDVTHPKEHRVTKKEPRPAANGQCDVTLQKPCDVKVTCENESSSSIKMNTNEINEEIKKSRKLNSKFQRFKNSVKHVKQNVQNSFQSKEKKFTRLNQSS